MILNKQLYQDNSIFKNFYLAIKLLLVNFTTYFIPKKERSSLLPFAGGPPHLTVDGEGNLQCTSCRLCQNYCPTSCIEIESDHDGTTVEKEGPPQKFFLNLLHCIRCGFCVEACPVDAIRMGEEESLHSYQAKRWVMGIEDLAFRNKLNGGKGIISTVDSKNRFSTND